MLRTGRVEILQANGQTLVFRRTLDDQTAVVAFNAGSEVVNLEIEASRLPSTTLSLDWPPTVEADATLQNATPSVHLPPRETRVWTTD